MLTVTPALFFSAAFLLALILSLALRPDFYARLTTSFMVIAAIGGLIIYSTGFMEVSGDMLLTVIRTPMFVLRMFVGVNELSAIQGSRFVSTHVGLIVFWILHLMAFTSIASAALSSLGAEAVRRMRFLMSHRGNLTLIYGINDDSIALGTECLAAGDGSVVFIAESVPAELTNQLNRAGMAVVQGLSAVACDEKAMRRLHIGSRKLTVYALDEAEDKDLFFALHLRDGLEKLGVPAKNTRVTLPGVEDIVASMLQASPERYGFGYVNVFDASLLTARALIRICPPWEAVTFGEDGRAKEDYECVIVGFGDHGQAVLKELVMNGQFAGSRFHAAVFSNHFKREAGYLRADSPDLLKNYDIQSYEGDARGSEFYNYIGSRLSTLKLIAVCTGDAETNREISDNLMLFLQRRRAENIAVVRVGDKSVRYQERVGSPIHTVNIYTRAFLSAEDADRRAILLNAGYDHSDRSDWEKWMDCDSFSKMSSRASAEFAPAVIRAAGTTREEMLAGEWKPSDEMLQNLGETEHLRWNAFHFAMGYTLMSREEFESNAKTWMRCKAEGVPCSLKIAKNSEKRTHACLVSWEELDELSDRENAVTNRRVNYKQTDIDNVLSLPRLLRAEEEVKAK